MKLNIYIGLRAIAYVITQKNKVVHHGIKRVNVEFDNYYEYIAGNPVTLRITRRQKRQARRNMSRFKSRRKTLQNYLKNHVGAWSAKKLHRDAVLRLKVKGLTEQLTPEELYLVLMSLQQKRGYKSLRGMSDNDDSEYLNTIAYHEEQRLRYRSISEYLLTLPSSKNIIFNRSTYEQEYWDIMKSQHLTQLQKDTIFRIIFYQRPIKRGAKNQCKLEKNRKVVHESHPEYQIFRCWRDANNIIVWDEAMNEVEITLQHRQLWAEKLISGRNLTKASVCKDLGIKKSTEYTWLSGKQLSGNPVAELTEDLWQDIFSATENERLRRLLAKKYYMDDNDIQRYVDIDMSKFSWSDYSHRAMQKLLPQLKQGIKLSEAILNIYGRVEMKEVALRNVILEKHFDSYKSLVQAIKKVYDIDIVQFEIDQMLKAGNKQRKEMARSKRASQKFNKDNESTLSWMSDYEQLKYRLWKESEGISPYEPDVQIPLEELFTDKYDLDHIVPKSKIFETGINNMVLCRKELNQKKGRTMPAVFARQLGYNDAEWREIAGRFGSKKQFLTMEEPPTDWISRRQNSDYNTKCFGTLADVNIPNKLINKFASEWNLRKYDDQDMRYYLYKAFVMANLDQSVIDRYDDISSIKDKVYSLEQSIPVPDNFESIIPYIPKVKYIRKTKYGYYPAKQLHQETILGKREVNGKTFYKVRQPLTKITDRMVSNIYDPEIKRAIEQWAAQHGGLDKAKESLEHTPFYHLGNIVSSVSVRMTETDIPFLHHRDKDGTIHSKSSAGKPTSFVYAENNYGLLITTDDKGRTHKELVTLLMHVDNLNGDQHPYAGTRWQKYDIVRYQGELYYFIGCGLTNQLRPVFHLNASPTIKSFDYRLLTKVEVDQLGNSTTAS